MNWVATIIVCVGVSSPMDCQEENARAVMKLPESFPSFTACVSSAMLLAAQHSLIHEDDYVRFYCTDRGEK